MTPELKVGDVVHVKMTVIELRGSECLVTADINDCSTLPRALVSPDSIVHVEKRAPQVGDKVQTKYKERVYEIRAIADGVALLRYVDAPGCFGWNELDGLERVS